MIVKSCLPYLQLMRWHRPIGILLLLWPTLWALWIAGAGHPQWHIVAIFIAGVIMMRSAGCVVNDLADRHIDGHVQRTRDRPLASGALNVRQAITLLIILLALALLLVLQLNGLTIALSLIGLILAILYPFSKRITFFPQWVLGATFAWSIPMAFAAQLNHIPAVGWLLYSANLCWIVAYDTIYAMADREDDLKIGVKSWAIWLGKYDRIVIGLLQILVVLQLFITGIILSLGIPFYLSLLAAIVLMIYQQRLIAYGKTATCFKAFVNNHWLGLFIFIGIMMSYWI